jgi:6-phosphogluconolactonase
MKTTASHLFAYIGTRTTRERNARGEGITVMKYDTRSGALQPVQVVGGLVNPSYLALNAKGDRLYTVHGDQDSVSAFAVDRQTGQLTLLNSACCEGKNPVHLAITPDGKNLVVSNHLNGTVVLMAIESDGRIGAVHQTVAMEGEPGPHRKEQPFAKPHFNPLDPSGRFVFVPDKGLDRVFVFAYSDGKLQPTVQRWINSREGAGPRNIAFHPQQPWAYVINELDSTVLFSTLDAQTGEMRPRQVLSTLPEDFTGNSRASSIAVHTSGRWLFASNRGSDTVAVFAIDAQTGWLRFVQASTTQGKTPRFFQQSPDGQFLFVLNEDSDNIATFRFDAQQGLLSPQGEPLHCASPVCLVFGH